MTFKFRHPNKCMEWHITYYLFWIRRFFRKHRYYNSVEDRKLLYNNMLKKLEFNYQLHGKAQKPYLIDNIAKLYERVETRDFYDFIMCLPELANSIEYTETRVLQKDYAAFANTAVYYQKYRPVILIKHDEQVSSDYVANQTYNHLMLVLKNAIKACN